MSLTLLQITQEILSEMDGDSVNSIFDTEESEQVASIVVSTYRALVSNSNWRHHKRLTDLVAFSDSDKPTHMRLQEDVKRVVSIRYDTIKTGETKKNYTAMDWVEPDDFLRRVNQRNSDEASVDVITDTSGIELLICNNIAPSYYTSFDDTNLIFDAYDKNVDTTLQVSKTQTIAYILTTLSMEDTAVPDIPEDAFTGLIEESKSRAQAKLRQFSDVKSEQESIRQRRFMSRQNWRNKGGIQYPNYGRKSRKIKRDVTFERGKE